MSDIPLKSNKLNGVCYDIHEDERFVLDFLTEKHVLLVLGRAFKGPESVHFRIVFLPHCDELVGAIEVLADLLEAYRQCPAKVWRDPQRGLFVFDKDGRRNVKFSGELADMTEGQGTLAV